MSDDEIRTSFMQAKNQKAQVQVLAELNAVSVPVMRRKLETMKLLTPADRPPRKKQRKLNEEAFRRAHALLLTDGELAARFHVQRTTVRHWREVLGLPINVAKSGPPPGRRFKIDGALEVKVMDLYDTGATDAAIARKLRISHVNVRKWRERNRLEANKRGVKRNAE